MKTTQETVLAQVATMSELAQEVFQFLVNSEKELTKSYLAAAIRELLERALKNCPQMMSSYIIGNVDIRKQKILDNCIEIFEVNEIMDFVTSESNKSKNKLINKIGFIRNLGLKTIGALLGMDGDIFIRIRKSNNDEYLELGDTIFLAGLYKELQKKEETNKA